MFSNKFLKYTAYLFAGSVVSEIVFRYLMRLKRIANECKSETNEVIFTNHLTQLCNDEHYNKNDMCKNAFCYKNNVNRIVELIDNAKYCIDLSMYTLTSYEFYKAFQRAYKRGVNIRIITDEKMSYNTGSHIFELHKEGIPVRYQLNTTMLMHHKFCVIDGKGRSQTITQFQNVKKPVNASVNENHTGILLSGSMNWTNQALCGNWENMIVTSNQRLIEEFENEFERIWLYFGTEANLQNPSNSN